MRARGSCVAALAAACLAGCAAPAAGPSDAGTEPAGASDSDSGYAYPGCEAAADYAVGQCADYGRIRCAALAIKAKHDACATVADCVTVSPEPFRCVDIFCVDAVRRGEEQAFVAEAKVEADRYCAENPGCVDHGSCTHFALDCVDGHCAGVRSDAGL